LKGTAPNLADHRVEPLCGDTKRPLAGVSIA
jgi:hypothetical protein